MSNPIFEKHTVFTSKTEGVHCYRIPALILTKKGTLIAFCEGRQRSCSDWAHSGIIMRRCLDPLTNLGIWEDQCVIKESDRLVEPTTWTEMLEAGKLAEIMGWDQESDDFEPKVDVNTNNPAPIVAENGRLHLIYCEHYDRVFYTYSDNDGLKWSKSIEITEVVEKFRENHNWTVCATGPGHGIQLKHGINKGRLIVPIWLAANQENSTAHEPTEVATLYSDDDGKTWCAGEFVPFTAENPNESQIVQLQDGRILMNSRHKTVKNKDISNFYRLMSISEDGVHGWTEYKNIEDLPEPMCLGSLNRFDQNELIFTMPDPGLKSILMKGSGERRNMTVWISKDEGKSWPISKTIEAGNVAYSDLAIDNKHHIIYCLFEDGSIEGDQKSYNGQSVAKFNLDWIKS